MKALLLKDYMHLEITDTPDPEVGRDEVLVRVQACGICGSDIHGYDGHTGRRIPPLIMGHEASGIVAEVGSEVTKFRIGDRVTFDSTVYCGKCAYCRKGDVNLCDNRNVIGVSCGDYRRHGAFAEYIAVPQHIVYRLPDSLPFEQAAMIESVSIAFHAANRSGLKLGDSVVVVGAGMIGQLVIQTLRLAGCGKMIALDMDDKKLELALKYGADEVINVDTPDVQQRILDLTDGCGTDAAFEVVGSSPAFNTAVSSLRKGGSLTMVGNLSPKVEMPLQQIVTRELTLLGVCSSSGEYPRCIDMMAKGKIDVRPFISAVAPLADGPMWFDRLYKKEPGLMKVVLNP